MGGDSAYEISQTAYVKLVLHADKHRTSAVNGILVGRHSPSGTVVEITDAVPLFHSQEIYLLPSFEIALLQIEEYYAGQGLSIVGYFHANERYEDVDLSGVAKNIGDQIFRYFPQAVILMLDNKKLEFLSECKDRSPVMQLYTRDAAKSWKLAESDERCRLTLREPSANLVLLDYLSSSKHQDIVDFDDYLDDISKDWLNLELFK